MRLMSSSDKGLFRNLAIIRTWEGRSYKRWMNSTGLFYSKMVVSRFCLCSKETIIVETSSWTLWTVKELNTLRSRRKRGRGVRTREKNGVLPLVPHFFSPSPCPFSPATQAKNWIGQTFWIDQTFWIGQTFWIDQTFCICCFSEGFRNNTFSFQNFLFSSVNLNQVFCLFTIHE